MRITVLTFEPDALSAMEQRLAALFPGTALELDFVFPSLTSGADDVWSDEVAPGLLDRLATLGRPVRVLHVVPGRFLDQLFDAGVPGLVVVCYSYYSERVAATVAMLATRGFPTMMLSVG